MSEPLKRIAINASNLHVGGGVQVAISFLVELSSFESDGIEFHVICSSEVDRGVRGLNLDLRCFSSYRVFDVWGLEVSILKLSWLLKDFHAVFTIFGPDYRIANQANTLVGFAQAWIIYPDNEVIRALGILLRLRLKLKLLVQVLFYKMASKLVVELPHVKNGVIRRSIASEESVEVVNNSISSIYDSPDCWEDVDLGFATSKFKIGFVGRDYSHKNLNILPEIKAILNRDYGVDVEFYVTLNTREWEGKPRSFKRSVNTVGELSVPQCPSFYQKMDGVIFPSLLECFSATPLEAMAMGRPLFASDRGFVRDVCKGYAYYFDPLSPASAADVIANFIKERRVFDQPMLKEAKSYVEALPSARDRAESYIRIIKNMVLK